MPPSPLQYNPGRGRRQLTSSSMLVASSPLATVGVAILAARFGSRYTWLAAEAADALRFAGVCRRNLENCRPGKERMIDFAEARQMMVDGQVRTYDVTDPRLLAAMLEV